MNDSSNIYDIKKRIFEAHNEVLVNKNPQKAYVDLITLEKSISNTESRKLFKKTLALACFESKKYSEAAKIFSELDNKYQAGFSEMLSGNIDATRSLWYCESSSAPLEWGKCLLDLVFARVRQVPTYLQVRNHLECDLGYLIIAGQFQYAENLLSCVDILANVNPEAYKFVGRALLHNDFPNQAVTYFIKSQNIIPQDPEIYYHLGQYSFNVGAYNEAKHMLKQCIDLNHQYTPAKRLLEKLEGKVRQRI